MVRLAFQPNLTGMGHRIRCHLLAKRIKELRQDIDITFLLRKDDTVDPDTWCEFPYVKDTFARSKEIMLADCLVMDGFWWEDFRTQIQKRHGNLVLISNPYGFGTDLTTTKRLFSIADSIIVPWPVSLMTWDNPLENVKDKVLLANPIMNYTENLSHETDRETILVGVSRKTETVVESIEKCRSSKNGILSRYQLALRTKLVSGQQYSDWLAKSVLIIAQGTGMIFEAMALGIPRIMVPLNESDEQMTVGGKLRQIHALENVPIDDVDGLLPSVIEELLRNIEKRRIQIKEGKKIVPASGTTEAAKRIISLTN